MATNVRVADQVPPAAWASWLNLILGLWMIISPWVVGYAVNPTALWNGVVLGILIGIAGIVAAQAASAAASWWNVAFGVWLFFSPWILQFGTMRNAVANNLIVGAVVVILALIAGLSRTTEMNRPLRTSPSM
jgi:hypothetical protein